MIRSKISGVGYYVPDNIVKNSDLEEMMNTSDQWIKERTGIEEGDGLIMISYQLL